MRAWLDALTPKQGRLMVALSRYLEAKGWKTIITTRNYEYSVSTIQRLGKQPVVVGKHGGGDLREKLLAYSERIIGLVNVLDDFDPDLLISFSSPEGTRTAFGLGIPSISFNDTPHAKAVARLAFPLSSAIVLPACIDPTLFPTLKDPEEQGEKVVRYNGVDEVSWTKSFQPDSQVIHDLGLDLQDPIIVLRPEEKYAAYYTQDFKQKVRDVLYNMLVELKSAYPTLQAVVFPRYEEQRQRYQKLGDWIIIPKNSVDTLSLLWYSRLLVTGGGTLSREAALLGIPAITFFPRLLEVNKYLSDLGFPVYWVNNPDQIQDLALRLFDQPRMETSEMVRQLESPEIGLERALERISISQ